MGPLFSLFIIITFSILLTRIATIALVHTGMSSEAARFQARSAFSGVGFTTAETEQVVNHPIRRRIVLLLMLAGNAGVVSAVASLLLAFIQIDATGSFLGRFFMLLLGVAGLWALSRSQWIDRRLSVLISWALQKWTDLDTRDYASLLHLADEYVINEMSVEEKDWLSNKTLKELRLQQEGVMVLGIRRSDGSFVGGPDGDREIKSGDLLILYGKGNDLRELDKRPYGIAGHLAHAEAVAQRKKTQAQVTAHENETHAQEDPKETE